MIKKICFPMSKKAWALMVGGVFLVIILVLHFFQIELHDRNFEVYISAQTKIKRVATALIEYCEKEGQGIFFPESLQILYQKGYLQKASDIVSPVSQQEYFYVSGLRRDMPFTLPILLEPTPVHQFEGKNYGGMIQLEFSSTLNYYEAANQRWLWQSIAKMKEVLREKEGVELIRKLSSRQVQSPFIRDAVFWRLADLKYRPAMATLKKHLRSQRPNYAPFALLEFGDQSGLDKIAHYLTSGNYFHRKRAWQILHKEFPSASALVALSPVTSSQYYQKWLKTSD